MKKLKRSLGVILVLFIFTCIYLHLSQESTLGTLTITGVISQEEVEWKKPSLPLEKAVLPTHEVFFAFPKEKQIHAFFWGDVIGIRYKVLEFRSFFHWMGCADFIEIEALCSDYMDLAKKQKYPSKILPLENTKASWGAKMYRSLWKKLFQNTSSNFFIQRASLHIEYFPLENTNRSFLLSCQNGKMVAD